MTWMNIALIASVITIVILFGTIILFLKKKKKNKPVEPRIRLGLSYQEGLTVLSDIIFNILEEKIKKKQYRHELSLTEDIGTETANITKEILSSLSQPLLDNLLEFVGQKYLINYIQRQVRDSLLAFIKEKENT